MRREALSLMGGFPEQMLMEDVELSLRMKRAGALCHIPEGIVVSGRRWEEMGFIRNFSKVVGLCIQYMIQRRFGGCKSLGDSLYRRYYGDRFTDR